MNLLLIVLLEVALQLTPIHFDPLPSPTPIATSTPMPQATAQIPTGDIYNALATTEAQLRTAPEDLRRSGGVPLLPSETGASIFGYLKWVTSASTAEEIFGPFSPFALYVGAAVVLVAFLFSIYLIIQTARYIIKFVQWLINAVLKLIPTMG